MVGQLQTFRLDHSRGGKPEHGSSLTTGTLVLVLYPSGASEAVTMDAVAKLLELCHQAVLEFDGRSGVRCEVRDTTFSLDRVTVTAFMSMGLVQVSPSTPSTLTDALQ